MTGKLTLNVLAEQESLKGFEQPKAGSSKAGSSKQVTARSKEAEKRARAAERKSPV